jgi:small subunit ribosomal protein S20|tara:strand:+ start:196 stop:465 length:270 start_codon:yes stop_codon:yes gene_type:complete
MPIKKSGKKELRKSTALAKINLIQKRKIKDTIKKIRKSVEAGSINDAKKLALEAVKLLDKAAKNRMIHKNTAARKKSRVYRAIKSANKK